MKKKKKKNITKYYPFIISLVLVILLFIYLYPKIISNILINSNNNKEFNLILLSTEVNKHKSYNNLYSCYLLSFDLSTMRIGVIYFPINSLLLQISNPTMVEYKTIDKLYAAGGWKYLKESLENTFKIKIPYFIEYTKNDFIKNMDLIEGLKLHVTHSIKKIDLKKNKVFMIPEGENLLLGPKLYEYLTFKDDTFKNINIVYRKKVFIKTLFEKFKSFEYLFDNEKILNKLYSFTTNTNIGKKLFFKIMNKIIKVRQYDVMFDIVPADKKKIKNHFYLNINPVQAKNILPITFKKMIDDPIKKDMIINIEILNATNVKGLALKTKEYLRQFVNIDVLNIENYKSKQKITQIISRTNDITLAQKVKEFLGIGKVKRIIKKESFVNVTVVLGEDCLKLLDKKIKKPFQ